MDILSRQHYIILRFNIALIFYSSKQEVLFRACTYRRTLIVVITAL